MSIEREPFIFDPNHAEQCAEFERQSRKRTRLLGKVAGSRTIEFGLIINAGFALAQKNLPSFALSAIGAAFLHHKANKYSDEMRKVDAGLDGFHESIGTDPATYNNALYRHLAEDGESGIEEAA